MPGFPNIDVRIQLVLDTLHHCIKPQPYLLSHNGCILERRNGSDLQNCSCSIDNWQRDCFIAGYGSNAESEFSLSHRVK